ncbi:hypothetical protein [Aquimarina sp. 2201CG14-23]|uniref:hypothetical protein n=1 Tax=Aquimarina mycalae TaxID=3040073 RepID=UPI002477F4F5|nr:hypothetical protein [Aquimarina sp. 2201CG14-23]MDH7447629.1 hypothetical protein [Aquimarina sp. 2201CG14-23]
MKLMFTTLAFIFGHSIYGQVPNDTIKVIAKQIASGIGSKVHIAPYKVLKTIKGNLTNYDTIQVGYYFYNEREHMTDTILLKILPYDGVTEMKNYYIFPEYNMKKGITAIDTDFWNACNIQGEFDHLYKFTWKDVLRYIEERKIDMKAYGFEVSRSFGFGTECIGNPSEKPFWAITYNKSHTDLLLGIIIVDGITGKIITEYEEPYSSEE